MIKKNNIPNYLTFLRIIAIPFIVILTLAESDNLRLLALLLFVLASISDYFDGYLARKWNIISSLGQMLDPIADKLLIGSLLVVFAFDGTFNLFDLVAAIIILMREIFISGLREFLGNKNIKLPVSFVAKYKTAVQMLAFILLFAEPIFPILILLSDIFLWLAAILTIWSAYLYWREAKNYFK